MKKIVSLILALALASLPILLYAAAATITSREQISMGNFTAVSGIATLTSGDTIATGLSTVIYFTMSQNPTSVSGDPATGAGYEWSASGGTVTVGVETGSLRYRFFAIGGP